MSYLSVHNLPVKVTDDIVPRIKSVRTRKHLPMHNDLLITFYNGYRLSIVQGFATLNSYELAIIKGNRMLEIDSGDNIYRTKSKKKVLDIIRRTSLL